MQLKDTRIFVAALIMGALPPMVAAQQLPGSEWAPLEMNSQAFPADADVFIRFEQDGRYVGHGGCNSFRGQFVTNQGAILFGPAAATRMACPDPIAKIEFEFFQTLNAVRGFERDGMHLSFTDDGDDVVLRLRQRDAD